MFQLKRRDQYFFCLSVLRGTTKYGVECWQATYLNHKTGDMVVAAPHVVMVHTTYYYYYDYYY